MKLPGIITRLLKKAVWGDEFKRMEETMQLSAAALQESEERYALFLACATEGLWDWNVASGKVYYSPRYQTLLGHDAGEFGSTLGEMETRIHPDDLATMWRNFRASVKERKSSYDDTFRMRHKNGGYVRHFAHTLIFYGDAGEPARVVGTHTDITEQANQGSRLQQLMVALDAYGVTSITDRNGQFVYVNDKFCRTFGYSFKELLGSTYYLFKTGVHPPEFFHSLWQTISSGRIWQGEICDRAKDGRKIWMTTTIVPFLAEDGQPSEYVAIRTDITERKLAELALQRFRAALDSSADAIFLIDPQTLAFVDVNEAACNSHGYRREELLATTISKIHHEADEKMISAFGNLMDHPGTTLTVESLHARKDGTLFPAECVYRGAKTEGMELVIAISRDVSERKRAQDRLRESEERYRATFEQAPIGIVHAAINGRFLRVNPKFCDITGYTEQELLERRFHDITHPDDLAANLENLQKLLDETISSFTMEKRYLRKDGAVVWVSLTNTLVCASDGSPKYFVAVVEDVTAHKTAAAERERLSEQLLQAQKMEALGRLAGGIAHDFNNILASIMGFTELSIERFAGDGEGKLAEYLNEIHQSGKRARDLIAQMMIFSRKAPPGNAPSDLATLVRESCKMLLPLLPATIKTDLHIEDGLPLVRTASVHVHQLLMNLCTNARDALHGQGSIRVGLCRTTLPPAVCASCHVSVEGAFVELSVRDNGPGIDAALIEQIFDPFFTTKEAGKGTGIGLSNVHSLVHQNNGHILVESTPGNGTIFRLLFPADTEATAGLAAADNLLPERTAALGTRILVVDDEKSVSRFIGEMLSTHGFQVHVLNDSRQALAQFEAEPDAFGLVVSDHTMPGMSGAEMARAMKALRPALPFILCSGYSEEVNAEKARTLGVDGFLAKPFSAQALFSMIDALIR